MGEVYLAHDAELDRNVAVKILPLEFSDDVDRKNRFRQEARAVSALNHPNIITIYEVGENEHGSFLVTEYIEGDTLREIINRRKLDLPSTLKIIEQIAKALAAAHQARIIHRDVKPENIIVRADGIVKVLDFGLAKPSVENGGAADEAVRTIPGIVMGSARYMSPEQARGLPVDERTDTWSLGVIVYEMLTGSAPFDGATSSDTIAAVIYKEPAPLETLAPNIPAELNRIVRKALQKDRDERYQNVKDFALDVKDVLYEIAHRDSGERGSAAGISENATLIHQTHSTGHQTKANVVSTADVNVQNASSSGRGGKIIVASLALILLAALAFGFYRGFAGKSNDESSAFIKNQVSRLSSDGKVNLPAISPNGKYVAYVSGEAGSRSLVVRQISTDSIITVVPATKLDFRSVIFSPADDYVFYTQTREDFSVNTLYQVPTLGGTPKKLIEDVDSVVTFSPDGKQIAFMRHVSQTSEDLIFTSNADGSNPQKLLGSRESGFDYFSPNSAWSPDGKKILTGAGEKQNGFPSRMKIIEISVAEKKAEVLIPKDFYTISSFCWFADGSGFLFTAQETREQPSQIWRASRSSGEIHTITNDFNNYTDLGLTADGKTIVTIKGESVSSLWKFTPLTKENAQLTPDSRNLEGVYGLAQLPDGKLLYSRESNTKINFQIADADGKNSRPIAEELGLIYNPVPSPDGRYLVFSTQKTKSPRIWRSDADGKNSVQLTAEDENYGDFNPQITADGKSVIFQRQNISEDRAELAKVSIEGGAIAVFYANAGGSVGPPRLSPNGKSIAFSEYDIATYDKRVVIASINGGELGKIEKPLEYNLINSIAWSPDSKSLTVSSVQAGVPNLFRLPLDGSPPQPLTEYQSGRILNFAWSNDGKNLFVVRGITNNDLILIRDLSVSETK